MVAAASLLAGLLPLHAADLEARLAEARQRRRAGELSRAADHLEETLGGLTGIESSPIRAALHRELAEVLLEQHRPAEAADEFEKVLEIQPNQGVLYYLAGIAHLQAGENGRAAERLDEAVRIGFRNGSVLLRLAEAHLAAAQYSSGLEVSREILTLRPASADLLFRLGKLLFQNLFYRDALQAFEASGAVSPSYETAFFTALTDHLLNRHEQAEQALKALDPSDLTSEARTLLASAIAQQDRFSEAEALLEKTIAEDATNPHAYLNLAFILLEQGRFSDAEARLDDLRTLGSAVSPKAFYQVRRNSCGEVAEEIRDGGAADGAMLERAQIYFELAESLQSRRHHATALELLRVARRHEGASPRVLYAMAYNCASMTPDGRAPVDILKTLLHADPTESRAHYLFGRVLSRQGAAEEAVAALRTAIELSPDRSAYHAELARVLLKSDPERHSEQAVQEFYKAGALDPRNVLARYELGKLLMNLGRREEALQAITEAIAIEPEFYQAYYILGQLHARADRREAARESFRLFQRKRESAEARSAVYEGFAAGGE